MRSWGPTITTCDEQAPVEDILRLVQNAQTIASRTIEASEQEYQELRNTDWAEEAENARRFYYLRWRRAVLRDFINAQALVTETLRQEADNVFHKSELSDIEAEENIEEIEVVIAELAKAA